VRDVALYMRAGALAQDVFRENAKHPGAAHMIIHAFDDPVHAPLGLYAAREYSTIAPAAPHAQHMTTHIFLALGLWNDVVSQNVVASGPDTSRWMPGHYTHWLLYGYLQQGRYDAASKLIASLASHASSRPQARGALANFRRAMSSRRAYGIVPKRSARRRHRRRGRRRLRVRDLRCRFRRGQARRSRPRRGAVATTNGAQWRGDPQHYARRQGSLAVPVILELSLRAELARADGKADTAMTLLRRAAALEDGMPAEFGPPAVVAPSHEALGALLMAAGRPADAVRSMSGRSKCSRGARRRCSERARVDAARGRADAAVRAYTQLAENWSRADRTVAGLEEARAKQSRR